MGTVYVFRGKAATGKTTLSNMLAKELSIPIMRIDDIVDALKTTEAIDKNLVNNRVCYNIFCKIIQTNLDLGVDIILDIGLSDRKNFQLFYDRLNLHDNRIIGFLTVCSNEAEWRRRHEERIKNPAPNQNFQSFDHVIRHYKNADLTPFEYEHIIDTANEIEYSFHDILKIINH